MLVACKIAEETKDQCQYILPTNSSQTHGHTVIYCKKTGKLLTFGRNDSGQLGIGNQEQESTPVNINSYFIDQKVLQISCGHYSTLILTNKYIYSFGNNKNGQLGSGNTDNSSSPINITQNFSFQQPKTIYSSALHNFVLTQQNHLFAFGWNQFGQLGDNSLENRLLPVDITSNIKEFKDQDDNTEVIEYVTCGYKHSFVKTNKSLYGFGTNESGQLGIGQQLNGIQKLPIKVDDKLGLDSRIKLVKSGYFHTIIITDQKIYTFGNNSRGQLGNNSQQISFSPVDITHSFTNENIISVNIGIYHSIIQTDKNLYAFGENSTANSLGDGSSQNQLVPTKYSNCLKDLKIYQIQCLGFHNFIESDKGLYAFGSGQYGQLGTGTTGNISYPILIDKFLC